MTTDEPLHVSRPHRASWDQEYRVYRDRIELRARILFCTLRIPLERIVRLETREPHFDWRDMFVRPLDFWWTYHNDRGGGRFVHLHQRGWPSRISFTPEDPAGFVAICNELRGGSTL